MKSVYYAVFSLWVHYTQHLLILEVLRVPCCGRDLQGFFCISLSAESEVLFSRVDAENRSCPYFTFTISSLCQMIEFSSLMKRLQQPTISQRLTCKASFLSQCRTEGAALKSNEISCQSSSFHIHKRFLCGSMKVVIVSSIKLRLLPMTAGMDSSTMWPWASGDTLIEERLLFYSGSLTLWVEPLPLAEGGRSRRDPLVSAFILCSTIFS